MIGSPVTIGCAVVLTPGATYLPDSGVITVIPQALASSGGMPLAVSGSICQMVNSLTGIPYPIVIPSSGCSSGIKIMNQYVVRIGDIIRIGSSILQIIGPPIAPYVKDQWMPNI